MKRLAGPLTLLLVIAAFNWKLLSGRYVWFEGGDDIAFIMLPLMQVQEAALHAGHLALWDPNQFGGEPLLGQLQPGLLNPFNYLLFLAALPSGHVSVHLYSIYFVMLQGFAGVAAFFLFADIGLSTMAAWIGAIFYALGGVAGNQAFPQVICSMIFPPLVILFLLRSERGARPVFNAALAGMFLGLSWFSGYHAAPLLMTLGVPAVFGVLIFVRRKNPGRTLLRGLACLTVAALVSAPQTWATLEFANHSMRWVGLENPIPGNVRLPYAAHNLVVRPSDLPTMLFPGDLSPKNPFAGWLFVGITGLFLSGTAIRRFAADKYVRLFGILAISSLLFALGLFNAFHGVAYLIVPGLDKLREPVYALILFDLGMAGLIALGTESILTGETARYLRRSFFVLASIAGATAIAYLVLRLLHRDGADIVLTTLAALLLTGLLALNSRGFARGRALFAGLAVLLLMEQANVSGHSPQTRLVRATEGPRMRALVASADLAQWLSRRPDVERIDANRADLNLNMGDLYGLEQLGGYEPAVYAPLVDLQWWRPAVMRLYGVNYYVAREPADPSQREVYASPSGLNIYANPEAFPRVWSVHHAVVTRRGSDLSRYTDSPDFDLSRTTFLYDTAPRLETCDSSDDVHLTERNAQSVTIAANMRCRGMVILSDNNYPGWQATVDGREVTIESAYGALRGVVVDAGLHAIRMRYRPANIYVGGWLTLLGLSLAGILASRREST